MKKICPECSHINDYENTECGKCGAALDKKKAFKMCPVCGKEYPLKVETCEKCGEKLIVCGEASAQVFDEKPQKGEIPIWARLISVLIPVVGIIFAVIYAIVKDDDRVISREDAKSFVITSILVQIVLCCALFFLISLLSGSGMRLMNELNK